ncbi:MAG: cyclic nucleotide-binding domain-containing protein [Actinobacteria bacterium]|nr:cyclic nucleotide-binding domain-containing protein [Actinomycetota bacterium]
MMIDIVALSDCEVFAGLSNRDLKKLAEIAAVQTFEAGAPIFEEDEAASNMYVVSEGCIALKMKSRTGQEVVVDELGPCEVVGWSAALEGHKFTASVSAIEPSTVLVFEGARLRRLFIEEQAIGNRVMGNMLVVVSGRLGHLRSKLVDEPFAPEWLTSPPHEGPVGAPCNGGMREMKKIACPSCGFEIGPLTLVNETAQYRCRNCGTVFYSPACCDTEGEDSMT